MKNALILLFLACSTAATTFAQDIHYVNLNASGNNDGTTWTDAFTDLQEALDSCYTGDTIWVAQGTYYGNYVKIDSQDVVLYGGFDGTETLESQRDWEANPTVLDGQGSGNLIYVEDMLNALVVDGITLENASRGIYVFNSAVILSNMVIQEMSNNSFGGGLYCLSFSSYAGNTPNAIKNVFFTNLQAKYGGALYYYNDGINNTTVSIDSCLFLNNTATDDGGAIFYFLGPSSYINNCVFSENSAGEGGAIYADSDLDYLELTNSSFTLNSAVDKGGAIRSWEISPKIVNCTFFKNSADFGGGIYTYEFGDAAADIYNNIFYGNSAVTGYSDFDMDSDGSGSSVSDMRMENNLMEFAPSPFTLTGSSVINNLPYGQDPQFIDTLDLDGPDDIWMTADDGLVIEFESPAAETGNTSNGTSQDIIGTVRPTPPSIGAYESNCLISQEPIAITCSNTDLYVDSTGYAVLDESNLISITAGNCGFSSSTSDQSTFDCSHIGTNSINITAYDTKGNTAMCTSTITVIDTIAAEVVCQNVNINLDNSGLATIGDGDLDGGSWDNCSLSFSASKTSFDCTDLGMDTLLLTVIELNGDQSACSSIATVIDTIQPVTAAQNLDVYLDANGNATITPQDVDNGSSDNCAIATQTLSKLDFDCNDLGVNQVTLTNTDASGNTSSTSVTVSVYDTLGPVPDIQNVTVYLDGNGSAAISTQDVDAGTSDNCGLASMILSDYTFNCNNLGANTVTLTATDVNGNITTATITVTVIDNIAPTISCQNITREIGASGFLSVTPNEVSTNSFDNCGSTLTMSQETFDCSDLGSNVVTLSAVDLSGNTSTCSSVITIVDALAPQPIISSLPTITETCELTSLDEPSVIDNCSPVTISHDATLPITASTTVIWTYADTSGNVSYQAQSIVINSVDVAVLQTDDLTLESLNLGADGYQWIDCSTNQPISGETQYEYTATQNGTYAVIVSEDGCQDTSACYTIDQVGVSSLETETLRIAPNPVSGGIVRIYGAEQLTSIQVMDASGKHVVVEVDSELNQFGVNHLAPGTYFVQLTTETASVTRKLVVASN